MQQIYFRPLLIFIFCLLSMHKSHAQGQKFAFLEGLGSGALVNANFDMRFKSESREGFGFKAGIGYSGFYIDEQLLTIPIGVNYLLGKNRSGLLLGVNAVISASSDHYNGELKSFVPSLELGYRFRPFEKGIAFQVTYNPLFNTVDGFKPLWFGVGLGYAW